jgi:hypothetical protein
VGRKPACRADEDFGPDDKRDQPDREEDRCQQVDV